MKYEERKNQLNKAVVKFLKKNGGGFGFPNKSWFNVLHFGGVQREKLVSLSLINNDNDVEVVTYFGKDEREVCRFTDFSNDEMVSIMELAGIDIPAKKVEENPENPCIIGIFVVSL